MRFLIFSTILAVLSMACQRQQATPKHDADKQSDLQQVFARKKFCAEIGRARLEEDRKKKIEIPALVSSKWCYNTALNTCIYSVETIYARNDIVSESETLDLLTNELLFSASLIAKPSERAAYEEKKKELFSSCVK